MADTLSVSKPKPAEAADPKTDVAPAVTRSRTFEQDRYPYRTKIGRRAYEAVMQHGLRPRGHTGRVVLFADPSWALKAGRRHDPQPVIVTVNVQAATDAGCLFRQFGETIFLTDRLPPACCRLPRPPKIRRPPEADQPSPASAPKTPGSFILSGDPFADQPSGKPSGARRNRSKDWKKERRRARRWKENQNEDY